MKNSIIYLENSVYDSIKNNPDIEIKEFLLNADYIRANLPPLHEDLLNDPSRGHWDLYWNAENIPSNDYTKVNVNNAYKSRNPYNDLQAASVAIDFGTTATVVAIKKHGRSHLLRIGLEDYTKPPNARDYENPTVLKFENFENIEKAWKSSEFRPLVKWADVKCSHQAKEELNKGGSQFLKSGFKHLKTWARAKQSEVTLIDKQNKERTFSPIHSEKDVLNPIELYAFFLGININNQLISDGQLFNEYFLTFPVKFEKSTKQRIINAFKNGLIKSMPASFGYQVALNTKESQNPNEVTSKDIMMTMHTLQRKGGELFETTKETVNSLTEYSKNVAKDYNEKQKQASELYEKETKENNDTNSFSSKFNKIFQLNLKPAYQTFLDSMAKDIIPGTKNLIKNSKEKGAPFLEKVIEQVTTKKNTEEEIQANKAEPIKNAIKEVPFTVQEIATEPIAYAASAFSAMDIKPTEKGIAFGVFDFGGGTSDFAVGLYRTATEEENFTEGWEKVLEILDSAGDETLGGEYILNYLAAHIIEKNEEVLLKALVQFKNISNHTKFPSGDRLFNNGIIAYSNTEKLNEKIRPLWENSEENITGGTGQLSIIFEDSTGNEQAVILTVDEEELNTLIKKRITSGVRAFFLTFVQAIKYSNYQPEELHILLAGNSCQSPYIMEIFTKVEQEVFKAEQNSTEDFEHSSFTYENYSNFEKKYKNLVKIHPPLLPNKNNLQGVTLKTGVALGILKILPGEPLGVVNNMSHSLSFDDKDIEEAPFIYSVGVFEKDFLIPRITRYSKYGEWKFLTRVYNSKVTRLGYTQSVLALENKCTTENCKHKKIQWEDEDIGKNIYISATEPDTIELALFDGEISNKPYKLIKSTLD